MPIYTCKKCGYAVWSKNIATRNSFPVEDEGTTESRIQMMTLEAINSSAHISVVCDPQRPARQEMWSRDGEYSRYKPGQDVTIRLPVFDYPGSTDTPENAFSRFIRHYNELDENHQKQFLCESFGGHEFDADGPPTC